MEKNIQDKDLGVITLRTTPRATRYTLKISKGKITATMPPGGDEKRMIAFIMENKARLIKALQKHPARPRLGETAPARRKIGVTGYDIPLAYLPHRTK